MLHVQATVQPKSYGHEATRATCNFKYREYTIKKNLTFVKIYLNISTKEIISMSNNKAVILSILLSIANITGSSGLTIWIDNALKQGEDILNAYMPLFSYLSGLSIGCMTISFFMLKIKKEGIQENIFACSLMLATINCFLFAKQLIFTSTWADTIHRIIWGVVSGFTVISGRDILIVAGNEKKTNERFSVLTLALLCLPFLIPILFHLYNLNNRTSADLFASFIYTVSLAVYLFGIKKQQLKKGKILMATASKNNNNIVITAFINLVIINVCFFLLLMIMPAIRVIYFNYIDIKQMYTILLILFLPCAVFSIKITKLASFRKKIITGNIMQLISSGLCFISISIGSGILYVFLCC